MALSTYVCGECSKEFQRERGEANRTLKKAGFIFCSRECGGLHRRSNKTLDQKKAEKAEYDRKYREQNSDEIKAKKAAYFKKTYDPIEAKQKRKQNMHRHVEYCRQPEYRAYKKQYDAKYRAKKQYGEFWESVILLTQLEKEILQRADFTERAIQKGTLNKCQNRKRKYEQQTKC